MKPIKFGTITKRQKGNNPIGKAVGIVSKKLLPKKGRSKNSPLG